MAKYRPSYQQFQESGVTHVKSKAYGLHQRAARGTYKPISCNEVLQQNAKKTAVLNGAAKPVHEALKQLADNFKQKDLWQQILSKMRSASTSTLSDLYASLHELEINSAYKLQRRASHVPIVEPECDQEELRVYLQEVEKPVFQRKVSVADQYFYEVAVLWMGKQGQYIDVAFAATGWTRTKDSLSGWEFRFEVPEPATYYILCLKLQAGSGGQEIESFEAKGMRIVGSGSIELFH